MSKETKQLVYLHPCKVERNHSTIFLNSAGTVKRGGMFLVGFWSHLVFKAALNLLNVKSTNVLNITKIDRCAITCVSNYRCPISTR